MACDRSRRSAPIVTEPATTVAGPSTLNLTGLVPVVGTSDTEISVATMLALPEAGWNR